MNTPDKDGIQPNSDESNSVLRVIVPVVVGGALVAVVVVVVVVVAALLVAVYKRYVQE